MAVIKNFNDLVISYIEYLRMVQPELDTKPGQVARDLFIDGPSQQLSNFYAQLSTLVETQSLFSASGTDLERLGGNFNIQKLSGTFASGVIILTFSVLDTDILIKKGTIVSSRNGINYETISDTFLLASNASLYRSVALRIQNELNTIGNTDIFAVEIAAQALTDGVAGNIGRFSIVSHNISGVSGVTNISSFSGGSDRESDDQYKSRIISIFSGNNIGTEVGYISRASLVSGVVDSKIVTSGNPLLIRDGTQVITDRLGNRIITNPGSGGKVDLYVLGTVLDSHIDSFIYTDKSGTGNAFSEDNDFVLGQRDSGLTNISQKRLYALKNNQIPYQPAFSIVNVSGSISGPNFVEKYTDLNGNIKGNYEFVKDAGDYGGSSFGYDKLKWISNSIDLNNESVTKGVFNGIDPLNYTDTNDIFQITQDVIILNENSTIASARNTIYLKNKPVRTVTKVYNLTTGERYVIANQNPDGGDLNTTGKITITGATLPVSTDVLQVDYVWIKYFDPNYDFDKLSFLNPKRTVQDSVDWGYSNQVLREPAVLGRWNDEVAGAICVEVSLPVSKVVSLDTFTSESVVVANGTVTLSDVVMNIIDMKNSAGQELYFTKLNNGILTGTSTVILPTDSVATNGDTIVVRYNEQNIYSVEDIGDGYFENLEGGSFIFAPEQTITIPQDVLATYVANINELTADETNLSEISTNSFSGFSSPVRFILDGYGVPTYPLKSAASNVRLDVFSIASPGSILITGHTSNKVTRVIPVTSGNGLQIDLAQAILSELSLSVLPAGIKLSKVVSVEKVNLNRSTGTYATEYVFDITNYSIKDNKYSMLDCISDPALNETQLELSSTVENSINNLTTGDLVRVVFYYVKENDTEQLFFSRNGYKITNKSFYEISRVVIPSGFKNNNNEVAGTFLMSLFNQPSSNTQYSVSYNYTAPKNNERITVSYNYNRLINDTTTSIETYRPITADVLVKEAKSKSIDVSLRVVLLPEYANQAQIINQDLSDSLSAFLSSTSMASTIDASDIINRTYAVPGVDRVQILFFGLSSGRNVLSLTAEENEYFVAGNILIEISSR